MKADDRKDGNCAKAIYVGAIREYVGAMREAGLHNSILGAAANDAKRYRADRSGLSLEPGR